MLFNDILLQVNDPIHPFWDQHLMDLIAGIKDSIKNQDLVVTAKKIAAVFTLIYFAVRALAMLAQEGKLEIMPLFRPFLIAIVITNFSVYTDIINIPANGTENVVEPKFQEVAGLVQEQWLQKKGLSDSIFKHVTENINQISTHYGGSGKDLSFGTAIKDIVTLKTSQLAGDMEAYFTVKTEMIFTRASLAVQKWITDLLLSLFKGIGYAIFFLQAILLYVLTCLGPISFAFSIAGPFKDAWVTWTSRFISVTFYKTIGFIVLTLSFEIVSYGFAQEINRLQQIMAKKDVWEQFTLATNNTDNYMGFLIIAVIVAIFGILSTPVMAQWIINSSGGATGLKGGSSIASGAKAVASGGASAGGSARSAAKQMIG